MNFFSTRSSQQTTLLFSFGLGEGVAAAGWAREKEGAELDNDCERRRRRCSR